jgi:hypothetical protein
MNRKKKLFSAPLIALVIMTACTESSVDILPDPCAPFPCDTCDNYYPPPSGYQNSEAVPSVCRATRGRISPDGRYVLYVAGNADYSTYPERNFPVSGLLVLEIASGRTVMFLPGFFNDWLWAADSRTVYYLRAGRQPLSSIHIDTEEVRSWPELGSFEAIELTANARTMYLTGVPTDGTKAGIVRWDIQTGKSDFITDAPEIKFNGAMVINDSVLCALANREHNVYFLNVRTKQLDTLHVPALEMWGGVGKAEISPDGTRILFIAGGSQQSTDGYVSDGIWLLDLPSLVVTQVLPRNPYHRFYREFPVWSSNATFVASWFCRKDSTELLYEYNVAGKPIRQLNTRYTKYWVEK